MQCQVYIESPFSDAYIVCGSESGNAVIINANTGKVLDHYGNDTTYVLSSVGADGPFRPLEFCLDDVALWASDVEAYGWDSIHHLAQQLKDMVDELYEGYNSEVRSYHCLPRQGVYTYQLPDGQDIRFHGIIVSPQPC